MEKQQRFWIVGSSSGIGLELVKILLSEGHFVVASSRTAQENEDLLNLQNTFKANLKLVSLDVNNDEELDSKVKEAWKCFRGLDLWFYNAGAYEVMDIDNWNFKHFKQMNDVNYLGVLKIMTRVLPYFQNQGFGRWLWNLSLSTYFGLPKGGGYSAPKAALLNLAQSIHPELRNKNITLQVVNHGFVKTRLTAKNDFEMPQLMTPQFTAKKIYEGIQKDESFEIRFPFKLGIFLRVLSYLPYKISLALTRRML
ncbi:SDR family NAD(P)-dependent oxidoreductase [Halarcobacter sp.]|uniref:SDR family NAD(P)-dependent oxidoreductase n=1 Tax=Halarcobacter sp. TaxID=2321133 RepID=UPI0029F568BC|nr:SDR family NAD(P)-dependent oxidoreductase [Halarcobacter sp.]